MKVTKEKGITLIALVVTIVILLILAGITINALTDNGLIYKTKQAKNEAKKAQYFEEINIEILEEQMERNIEPKTEVFIDSLKYRLEGKTTGSINEGKIYSRKEWVEKATKYVNDTVLVVETKDGYQIYIDVDNNALVAKIREESFGKITQGVTLIYDPNGGNGTTYTQNVRPGLAVELQENTYMKEDYSFGGWEDRNSGITYLVGEYITINEDTTLYAVWTKESSTLTLNSNYGENETEVEHIQIGNAYSIPVNSYVRQGYFFTKWNTEADGTGINYDVGDTITITSDNVVLYAQWEEVSLTFNKSTDEVIAGETLNLSLTTNLENTSILTWSSNNASAATVNNSGVVTGIALGKSVISVTDGVHTASINISTCEYLQYNNDMKVAKTGGFHVYKTSGFEVDGLDTSSNLCLRASNIDSYDTHYTVGISNNVIDFSNISKLEFDYSVNHNYSSTLTTTVKVGISSIDSNDLNNNWIAINTQTSQLTNYSNTVNVNCNSITSGYLKLLILHGTETNWYSAFLNNYYILAKP